jgi:protease-4
MRFKEWQKIILLIALCFFTAMMFYRSLFSGITAKPETFSGPAVLELTLSGAISERSAKNPFREAIDSEIFQTLEDLRIQIRNAKLDERVKALLIRPMGLMSGWAKIDEIRDMLRDFKTSGKPIYAYLEYASDQDYYICTAADTIVGLATGIWNVNGFAARPVFFKNSLEKIGVQADFVAFKEYKTAPNEFTREEMSPQQREVINAVIDQYYGMLTDTIATSRNISQAQLQEQIDIGLYSIANAQKQQFVDTLMYYEALKEHLKLQFGESIKFVNNQTYRNISATELGLNGKSTIAVVYGVGAIISGGEGLYRQGEVITSEGMSNAIRKAADDDKVKAIIIRLDSPGGSGTASDVIWRQIREAAAKKPVIASVSDVAASGGYYLAMAADTIVAHPNSLVGSIGVYAGKFALGGLYKKLGITTDKIMRGRNADLFSEETPFSPEQRRILSNFLLDFYHEFVGKVALSRGLSPDSVEQLAKGRVWTGRQGYANGLIDVLGNFNDAVRIAKQMSGIPEDEKVKLLIYPRLESFWERLIGHGIFATARTSLMAADLPGIPTVFRRIISALPYFNNGEPLFLEFNVINVE